MKNFDGVENEYPIYFGFMIINNIFSNNLTEAKTYYDSIKNLLRTTPESTSVLPYYYYVPRDDIEKERLKPNSQDRIPSPEVLKGSSHLWTQSIWIICQLLGGGLI